MSERYMSPCVADYRSGDDLSGDPDTVSAVLLNPNAGRHRKDKSARNNSFNSHHYLSVSIGWEPHDDNISEPVDSAAVKKCEVPIYTARKESNQAWPVRS